jgi:ornithine cyclodeaminase/alanine dehydrogenase-like protein (mu-crystallin family)
MEFFNSKTIEEIATHAEWIESMEQAMLKSLTSEIVLPKRMHLDHGNDTFLLMPCITEEYWSTKLVSFNPANKLLGRPSIYGTLVLNDTKTGEPLAIMEGSAITALRTAAITAVGIKNLSPVESHSLGIIGTGVQGVSQALFACSVRQITEIWAFDQNKDILEQFSTALNIKRPEIKIIQAADSTEVALNSEVIISATNSKQPVFPDIKELFTGKTFVGIGSYKPDCREFPEQLFRQLDQLFVDTLDGKKESGDLVTPVQNNWISEDKILPLASLLSGGVIPALNSTRFFKTVGSAVFDLYAAKLVYEKKIKPTN